MRYLAWRHADLVAIRLDHRIDAGRDRLAPAACVTIPAEAVFCPGVLLRDSTIDGMAHLRPERRYVERPRLRVSADRCARTPGTEDGPRLVSLRKRRREAIPDPAVDAMIEAYRHEIGVTPRKITHDEIATAACSRCQRGRTAA